MIEGPSFVAKAMSASAIVASPWKPALIEMLKIFSNNVIGQPNDVFTRQAFVDAVEPWLETLSKQGVIASFSIDCDTKNNTAEVIANHGFIAKFFIQEVETDEQYWELTFTIDPASVEFNTSDEGIVQGCYA